jgi:TPR repeat protein
MLAAGMLACVHAGMRACWQAGMPRAKGTASSERRRESTEPARPLAVDAAAHLCKSVAGERDVQYQLGKHYRSGFGVFERDEEEAFKWFSAAAQQGHIDACFELGLCFNLAIGTSKDDASAVSRSCLVFAIWLPLQTNEAHCPDAGLVA